MTWKGLDKSQARIAQLVDLMPLNKLPVRMARMVFRQFDWLSGLSKTPLEFVTDYNLPDGISVRCYVPNSGANKTMVYFHGGGCVIGSIETHDNFCRLLAEHAQLNIVSVAYRKAPEHPFPAPVNDAITAWNWIGEHREELGIKHTEIGVGGDSAGGYLALLLGLSEEQQPLPVKVQQPPSFQFLLYPMVDLRGNTESFREFNSNLLLTSDLMEFFKHHFIADERDDIPLISPLVSEHHQQSPRTLLVTVGFDPLLDACQQYATKLRSSGIPVTHLHLPDCMHQFISVTRLSKVAHNSCLQLCDALKQFTQEK